MQGVSISAFSNHPFEEIFMKSQIQISDLVLALIQAGKLPIPAMPETGREEWAEGVIRSVADLGKLLTDAQVRISKASRLTPQQEADRMQKVLSGLAGAHY